MKHSLQLDYSFKPIKNAIEKLNNTYLMLYSLIRLE